MRSARYAERGLKPAPAWRRSSGQPAFTLIELLVVIAVIGVLAALLLPVLARSKTRALTAGCLSNLKQLQACWLMYADDNNDCVPPNNFVFDIISQKPISAGDSWCTNLAPFDASPTGIQQGMLFHYNTSLGIYHCPADRSLVQTFDGVSLGVTRFRSYNMSQSLNGYSAYNTTLASYLPSFQKLAAIRNPSAADLIVFLDVHEDEIMDTLFGIPVRSEWYYRFYWFDIPANRHNQGSNFSFADGHAEHWRWKTPKTVSVPRGSMQPVLSDELEDYDRLEAGFRQSFN